LLAHPAIIPIGGAQNVTSFAAPRRRDSEVESPSPKIRLRDEKMVMKRAPLILLLAVTIMAGCSRQQSDWEKTRASNTTDSYELFLKKYPSGEFSAQAQARLKGLYEERDWQKARDTDTAEAYQAFLKQYPEGKYTDEARIRVENFTLAAAPPNTGTPPDSSTAAATPPTVAPVPPAAMAMTPSKNAAPPPMAMMRAAPPKGGSYGIQLGAFKSSADAANKRWTELVKKYPASLGGLTPKVSPKKGASGTLYRLQVAGLSEKQARDVCNSLKSKSQACVLVPPGTG
jgi:cell division protein FtsN